MATEWQLEWRERQLMLNQIAKLEIEIERLRVALEEIVRSDEELFCNFCEAAEIAKKALED